MGLKKGNNVLRITFQTDKTSPNLDCLYFDIDNILTITSEENKTYTYEAEEADLSNYKLTDAKKAKIETGATASAGKNICNLYLASGYIDFTINSNVAGKVTLYLQGATGVESTIILKNAFSFAWNGKSITTDGVVESKGWSAWQKVTIATVTLKQGENTLRIAFKATAPNVDCIYFEVNNPDTLNDVSVTDDETTWKAEAEDCVVTGTPANNKTAFTENAGNYLCCLGKSGNKIIITIWSDKARTVSVSMAAGHNYPSPYTSLDYANMFTATINGTTAAFSGTFTATGWTNFASVTLGNIDLKEGTNTLVFTVKDVRVPNIDCFTFTAI